MQQILIMQIYFPMNLQKHELKTVPPYFDLILEGDKTGEMRYNDRYFQVGDRIIFKEWIEQERRYTGRELTAKITHILFGGQFGIESGWVMLSFTLVNTERI